MFLIKFALLFLSIGNKGDISCELLFEHGFKNNHVIVWNASDTLFNKWVTSDTRFTVAEIARLKNLKSNEIFIRVDKKVKKIEIKNKYYYLINYEKRKIKVIEEEIGPIYK